VRLTTGGSARSALPPAFDRRERAGDRSDGGFNQARIFYHFGGVQNALLAALDLISDRRLAEYRPAFESARTASELGRLARAIYDEDLERGYITAFGEMQYLNPLPWLIVGIILVLAGLFAQTRHGGGRG
jgi:hypothetical protein